MELRELKRTCKDKISKDQVEATLDLLLKHIDEDKNDDIIKITGKYRYIQKQNYDGVISYDNKYKSINQLRDALSDFVKNLEESDLKKEEIPKDEKQKSFLRNVLSSGQNTLSNKIFTNDSLEKTELKNMSFNKCEFTNCTFSSMLFEGVNFTDCEFVNVTFEKFTFYKVEMYDCKIDAKFQLDFSIIKSSFYKSRLENVLFERGKLVEIDFTSTNMISAKIQNNIAVIRPNFANADLKRAIIEASGLRSEELFVCRSLEDADLPYTIALEIAESPHVWKLMSYEQVRELNPSNSTLVQLDEIETKSSKKEQLEKQNQEDSKDEYSSYSSSDDTDGQPSKDGISPKDIINLQPNNL